MEEIEIWRDIPEYKGLYQVSSFGRIKSLERIVYYKNSNSKTVSEKFLKSSPDAYGYLSCCLSKFRKSKRIKVHKMVSISFLNHNPCGMKLVVDHIDGNKNNNSKSNLRIVSNRENGSTCFRKNSENYSSSYAGVYWNKDAKIWRSQIQIEGISKYLGGFVNEIDAHNAYQNALSKITNIL